MVDAIVLWLHILAAVVFIGPQIFLVLVAVPAMRTIGDLQVRRQVSRAVTRGFGVLGGIALAVLLATGIWNYYDANDRGLVSADDFPRYFIVLQVKLTLVTAVVVLTVLHGGLLGRRLQELQERGAPEAEVARMRQWSVVASVANLAASIAILFCAALLGSDWSKL